MYEKYLVTALTVTYNIWVCLNHKTCFQPKPHSAIDLSFSEYYKPDNKVSATFPLQEQMDKFPFLIRKYAAIQQHLTA